MKERTPDQKIISADIHRFKTNKFPANMALLAIVFNALYIMLLYGIKISTVQNSSGAVVFTKFASLEIGLSVIVNLVVMLVAFLASEGIKGYNKKFSIVLLVLAAVQIFRVFGYPLYGLQNNLLTVNFFWIDPTTSTLEFILLLIYLVASAACFIVSAVFGYLRTVELEKHNAKLASGEIDIDVTLKALDEADEKAAKEAEELAAKEAEASTVEEEKPAEEVQ